MEKYRSKPVQSKQNLPEVQNRRDSGGAGILDTAAHISNQAMLSLSGRLALEEAQSGSTPAVSPSLDQQMLKKFERRFGLPMDDVRIHRNSRKPDEFDASAITYGRDVYLGPGQEELLPHELTHAVQQKMGMVPSQGMENGLPVNSSPTLERGADEGSVHGLQPGSTPAPVVQKCPKKARTSKYPMGTYGARVREQKRLTDQYGQTVSGESHQAEHAIGFFAVNHSGRPRKEMGEFERSLPAYQEEKPAHRSHMGTGYGVKEDAAFDSKGEWTSGLQFGFDTDQEYRDAQYAAVTDDASGHGVGNAVQLNQLGYSVPYQHGQFGTPTQIDQANDSFFQMVSGMDGGTVPFYESGTGIRTSRPVSHEEAAEMALARLTMQGQSYPSVAVENQVRAMFGVPQIDYVEQDPSRQPSYEEDQERMLEQLRRVRH